MTSSNEPTPLSEEYLKGVLQDTVSSGHAGWATALYALFAAGCYFVLKHLAFEWSTPAASWGLVFSTLEALASLGTLALALHAVYRWQAYARLLRKFAQLAPLVSESLKEWFYTHVCWFFTEDFETSEGFFSLWNPDLATNVVGVAVAALMVWGGVSALLFSVASPQTHWHLGALLLAVALAAAALLPRLVEAEQSPARQLLRVARKHFGEKRVPSPEVCLRVPVRLRGPQAPWFVGFVVVMGVSTLANSFWLSDSEESAIATAFTQALTTQQPGGDLAQARAAYAVATRPPVWGAEGVSVYPNADLVPSSIADSCNRFPVGDNKPATSIIVCGQGFTVAQQLLVQKWVHHASPQAAMALETVTPALRGFETGE